MWPVCTWCWPSTMTALWWSNYVSSFWNLWVDNYVCTSKEAHRACSPLPWKDGYGHGFLTMLINSGIRVPNKKAVTQNDFPEGIGKSIERKLQRWGLALNRQSVERCWACWSPYHDSCVSLRCSLMVLQPGWQENIESLVFEIKKMLSHPPRTNSCSERLDSLSYSVPKVNKNTSTFLNGNSFSFLFSIPSFQCCKTIQQWSLLSFSQCPA